MRRRRTTRLALPPTTDSGGPTLRSGPRFPFVGLEPAGPRESNPDHRPSPVPWRTASLARVPSLSRQWFPNRSGSPDSNVAVGAVLAMSFGPELPADRSLETEAAKSATRTASPRENKYRCGGLRRRNSPAPARDSYTASY